MKKHVLKMYGLMGIFLLALFCVSCNQNLPSDEQMLRNKDEYRQKIESTKQDIDRKISDLQFAMSQADSNSKEQYKKQITKLDQKIYDLNEQLDKLGKTTKEKWRDYQEDVDKMISDLGDELKTSQK